MPRNSFRSYLSVFAVSRLKRCVARHQFAGFLLALMPLAAVAQHTCVDAKGQKSFQQLPCEQGTKTLQPASAARTTPPERQVLDPSTVARDLERQLEQHHKNAPPRAAHPRAAPVESEGASTSTIDFRGCLAATNRTIVSLGLLGSDKVRMLTNSPELRMVRLCTADGSVLITCSAPDQKMVVMRSASCQ